MRAACTLGGSTALVWAIDPIIGLVAQGLGDCTLLVVRRGGVFALSERTAVKFDRPLQLGFLSPENEPFFQVPQDCTPFGPVALEEGDTVLCVSDGVTDNLHAEELVHLVGEGRPASALALAVIEAAQSAAVDGGRDGPFALAAKDNDIVWTAGGRLDDITALVVRCSGVGGAFAPTPTTATPFQSVSQALLPWNAAATASPLQ